MPNVRITTQTIRRTRSGNKTITLVRTVKPKPNAKTLNINVKASDNANKTLDVFKDGKKIASI